MVTHHSDVAEPVNGSRLTYAELWVDGMTCASCAARVQRALTKLAGVSTAGVNFATGKASVDYDAAITSPEAIEAAVTRSGYGPRPVVDVKSATISEASEAERLQGDSREQRAWLVRTGVALRSGAVPRRGDRIKREVLLGMTQPQVWSLTLVVIGVGLLVSNRLRRPADGATCDAGRADTGPPLGPPEIQEEPFRSVPVTRES